MVVKVFVLGRPGSGKSSAAYCIAGFAWRRKWSVIRFKDYDILQKKFKEDTEHNKFRPADHGGFEILDFSVFDEVSEEVERQVQEYLSSANTGDLIIIEFARHDYSKALRSFSAEFLQNAYFLFIETDVETCIHRIHKRVAHHRTEDDNFVPDDVLRNYYSKDNRQYISSRFTSEYGINKLVEIIDNVGSQYEFAENVYRFVERIFEQEAALVHTLAPAAK